MSFLQFMITNTEYSEIHNLYGVFNWILWLLVNILTWICNTVEQIYNHIFSLFNVVYSPKVIGFIKGWLGFLWIPIAISIVILAYSLIMGESSEGNVKLKTFVRNICVLAVILFGLPYLFIGSNNSKYAVFTNSNSVSGYTNNSSSSDLSSAGLVDIFTNDNGNGIVKGVSKMSGVTGGNHTYSVVASNVYDLKYIYQRANVLHQTNSDLSYTKDWYNKYLGANQSIPKNVFQEIDNNGKITVPDGDNVMGINVAETMSHEDVNDNFSVEGVSGDDLKVKDVLVSGYEYSKFEDGDDTKWDAGAAKAYGSYASVLNDSNTDIDLKQWLFKMKHENIQKVYSDNKLSAVIYSCNGKTHNDFFGILSPYPFRYHIEWGIMFIELISTALVLFLTSYKVVKIIYEITVNQFLVIFFGAADLSSGQKTKEVLRSLFGLIISLFTSVILVEFYFIIADAIKSITFISGDTSANAWMQALVTLFVAMAAIKGPDVLQKVLGVEGGLSGAWRDMGALNRFTKPARNAAKKTAKGAAILGAAGGYYAFKKHQGKKEAKKDLKEQSKGNNEKTGVVNNKPRSEKPGNATQFSAAKGNTLVDNKNNMGKTPQELEKGANGISMANASYGNQARNINKEIESIDKANKSGRLGVVVDKDQAKSEIANKYRGNIQNAALAEQASARNSGKPISERQALETVYKGSGFNETEAKALASRDLSDGTYKNQREKFENSISASAQTKLNDSPTMYKNQLDAYKEAAKEHYQGLGFDSATAEKMSSETAKRVLVDDKQAQIRSEAKEYIRSGSVATESEAVRTATTEVMRRESVAGMTLSSDDLDKYSTQILSQGSLKEGITEGRIANNAVAQHSQTNTRAAALHGGELGPGMKAGLTMLGGYFVERGASTLADAGTKSGYNKVMKKAEKKAKKAEKKLKKKN